MPEPGHFSLVTGACGGTKAGAPGRGRWGRSCKAELWLQPEWGWGGPGRRGLCRVPGALLVGLNCKWSPKSAEGPLGLVPHFLPSPLVHTYQAPAPREAPEAGTQP